MKILSAGQLSDLIERAESAGRAFVDAASKSARSEARYGRTKTIDLSGADVMSSLDEFDAITDQLAEIGLHVEAKAIWDAANGRLEHAILCAAVDPWAGPEAVSVGSN